MRNCTWPVSNAYFERPSLEKKSKQLQERITVNQERGTVTKVKYTNNRPKYNK